VSEEIDKPDRAAPEDERRGPQAGERLAEARRRQQITVLEIAKELHLDEPKIRALEQNDFDVLGAPVFAKGHMRKYAQLVGVDFDDVLADYYHLNRSAGMPPVVLERRKRSRNFSPGPWIAGIIIVLIAMIVYWLLAAGPGSSVEGTSSEVSGESSPPLLVDGTTLPATELLPPMVADESASPAAGQPLATASIGDDVAAQEIAAEPSQLPVAGDQVHLLVTFSADCWTEISDADGRRLYFEMGRSGESVEVSGAAPLSVLFGNADAVSLRVNGADYSIAAGDRRGQTVQLTLSTS
jgi:cytoskeletal protein RodZ